MTVSRVTRANGAPMVKTAKRKASAVFGPNGRGKPYRVEHKAVGGGVITKVTDRTSGRVHLTAHTDNRGKVQRMLADGSMRPLSPAEVTRLPKGSKAPQISAPAAQPAAPASKLALAGGAAALIGAAHNFRAAKDAGDSKTMAAVKTAAPLAAGYLLGRAALPVFAAVSAAQGAFADKSTARGAVRGLINAVDPTQLYTAFRADKRGYGQRAFDATFGAPEHRPRGVAGVILGATSAPMVLPSGDHISKEYKNTWTDKNGVVRIRRDFSVRKGD